MRYFNASGNANLTVTIVHRANTQPTGRPLKIAFVVPGFQKDPSDWCIPALTNLAARLSETVELHVFSLRYPAIRRDYRVGKVYVHALGGGAFGKTRVVGVSLLRLWAQTLAAMEREHRTAPFAAIVGVWATESGWLATRAGRRLGMPSLVHLAGGELVRLPQISYGNRGEGLAGRLVASTLRAANMLTVPSATLGSALPGWVNREKVRAWALGVDTTMFRPEEGGESGRPEARRASDFTFITVGSLIPVKGHEWLLDGLAELNRTARRGRASLQIVGSGRLRPDLEAQAERLGIKDRVRFVGEVPHDRLPDLYRKADAFIFGSWHEAQCMAALEAMSCGLPLVGPPVGAPADIAAASRPVTGIAVQERTPAALAEAMGELVSLPAETLCEWGAAARARVCADYCLDTRADGLLDLVQELMDRTKS